MAEPFNWNRDMSLRGLMLEELNDRNKDPDWFVEVCARVADGEGLRKIAEKLCVRLSLMRIWIGSDPGREKLFMEAMALRDGLRREEVKEAVYELAVKDVEEVTESGKLRAADLVLNPKSGVDIKTDGGKITIIHESQ